MRCGFFFFQCAQCTQSTIRGFENTLPPCRYTGPEGDLAAVQAWLAELFRSHCPGELYPHYTTAIDTANIEHVFDDVQDILFQRMLSEHNLGP